MIRGELSKNGMKGLDHDPHFRWRGEAVTRIENLSDIVFALALGMLISTSEPLRTFDDLQGFLLTAAPVALGFLLLLQIWHGHFTFFRRYGVADRYIIFLNALLLFVVMYLAYPLRLMFDGLFSYFVGFYDGFARMETLKMNYPRSGLVVGYFAIGYGLINLIFIGMYNHVIKKRDWLALSESELKLSRKTRARYIGAVVICSIVAALSMLTPLYSLGSLAFLLNAPLGIWIRRHYAIKDTDIAAAEN